MSRALTALGIGLPALFYINYVVFDGAHSWPLYAAATVATAAGIVLAWKLCRGRSRVWAVITVAFSLGGIWTVVALTHHAPDQGILALLFEIFLTFAALYWFDFRRTSTGVADLDPGPDGLGFGLSRRPALRLSGSRPRRFLPNCGMCPSIL